MFLGKASWRSILSKRIFRASKRRGRRSTGLARTLRLEPMEYRQLLAVLTVNSNADTHINTNGLLTLREAIEVVVQGNTSGLDSATIANQISGGPLGSNDTIKFAGSLNGGVITLDLAFGELSISKPLVIDASTLPLGVNIYGNDPTPDEQTGTGIRIFNITDPTRGSSPPLVELNKLALRGGDVFQQGGAIRSEARLLIRNSTIEQNAADSGGAVYVEVAGGSPTTPREVLKIEDSVIHNNDAFIGGGIAVVSGQSGPEPADTISITRTTISDNDALSTGSIGGGGGVYAQLRGTRMTLSESTISGNTAAGFSLYSFPGGGGGGMYAELRDSASLSVDRTLIDGNTAINGDGGGITAKAFHNFSNPYPTPRAITITRSTISNNQANVRGGGLFALNFAGTETLLSESRITGNHVLTNATVNPKSGGGIYAYVWNDFEANSYVNAALKPRWTMTNSTVDNNDAPKKGGGIFVCSKYNGDFIATNSTISGNRTTDEINGAGGGIYFARPSGSSESVDAWLTNLTVSRNVSVLGGGIATLNAANVRVRIANSIISENFAEPTKTTPNNLAGRIDISTTKYNLVGSGSTILDLNGSLATLDPTNLTGNDTPGIGDLLDNGGLTPTHSLIVNSPAIDRGNNVLAKNLLTNEVLLYDQRGLGFARKVDMPGFHDPGAIVDIGAYEVGASILGDYDHDGDVDCDDYLTWRSQYGDSVTPNGSKADGNNNGIVDAADYVIWANAYDSNYAHLLGDFNHNGTVDAADYEVWRNAKDSNVYNMDADANCDGLNNSTDYLIWKDRFGSRLAAARFGVLDAIVGPSAPPEVVGIALVGAVNTESYDFTVPTGSGQQLRSVPLTTATAISITFNQTVIVTQSALQVVNLDGSVPAVTNFAYDSNSQTAIWTFASSLSDGRYLVRLADSVHNAANAALDGEFTNPWSLTQLGTSVLPASGNGTAGGEFRFRFTVLAGDTDHNNIQGSINYQNWKSYEPGQAYVSTLYDDYDADVSFGDFSLREAINYANTAAEPTTIYVPAGQYGLSIGGTGGISQGDLDVTGNVTIIGAGPGLTIINGTSSRILDVANLGVLNLSRVTLATGTGTHNSDQRNGGAVRVNNGGQLHLDHSAVVGNETGSWGVGGGIYFDITASGSIEASVITVNYGDQQTGGLYLEGFSGTGITCGTVTIKSTIIANNWDGEWTEYPDVYVGTNRTLNSLGYNRFTSASGFTLHATDYIGAVDYVVTSIADTYSGGSDPMNMSLRDAIDLANTTAGTQEIWLPAWDFVLTQQRTTAANMPELNVWEGDIEITDSVVIRGIGGSTAATTNIKWMTGAAADKVFELVGDYDGNRSVGTIDYYAWLSQQGLSGTDLAADGDDDGDVDANDYNLWLQNNGHTLVVSDVAGLPGGGCA